MEKKAIGIDLGASEARTALIIDGEVVVVPDTVPSILPFFKHDIKRVLNKHTEVEVRG